MRNLHPTVLEVDGDTVHVERDATDSDHLDGLVEKYAYDPRTNRIVIPYGVSELPDDLYAVAMAMRARAA